MAYYSISAQAPGLVGVPEALTVLDRGLNVFTVVTDDIDVILNRLRSENVVILTYNRLDAHEGISPDETAMQLR